MLLVIDVGNTNTVIGLFDKTVKIKTWRIRTEKNRTDDEFYILFKGLFIQADIKEQDIDKIIISCVVPPVARPFNSFCIKYLKKEPAWVNAKTYKDMPVLYDNPSEVGADRIVNAVCAYEKHKSSLIIIDFGTATTFDAVSEKGEYLGGAILPGIMISAEALFSYASKLPRVELLKAPPSVIGKNTEDSIKSGIIYGSAAMVDGMILLMAKEMKTTPKVIATGGLAGLIKDASASIDFIEPDLTLEGLRLISLKTE